MADLHFPYIEIRRALKAYYAAFARPLPWRETRDPYRIWVSEIMLQQTQVETVIPRYHAFLATFPSLKDLASATVEEVIEAWAGLGYYRRARSLHQGAQYVLSVYAGQVPQNLQGLLSLPGVGPYTAGAIGSIAFGLPLPIVDGNVARVASRLFRVDEAMDTAGGKAQLWAHAQQLVCPSDPATLNQAIMEVGALICRPLAPKCLICPLREHCAAYQTNQISLYPRKKAATEVKALSMATLFAETHDGIVLVRRPLTGRWAGLWELPSAEGPNAKQKLENEFLLRLSAPIAQVTHRLTHRLVTAEVYRVARQKASRLILSLGAREIRVSLTPENEPLSGLARKLLVASRQASTFDAKCAKAR